MSNVVDLYGPWMVASTRRRRVTAPVVKWRESVSDRGEGSQFAVLQNTYQVDTDASLGDQEAMMEDGSEQRLESSDEPETYLAPNVHAQSSQVHKNIAYMESNPTRKSIKNMVSNKRGSSVTVVPLGPGIRSEVVEYVHSRKSGNHTVVSINDTSPKDMGACRSKGSVGGIQIGNNVGTQIHMDLCRDDDPGDRQMQVNVDNVIVVDNVVGVGSPLDRGVEPQQ
ncbi:hypothetical protein V6N13_093274 [Hibiscus sabdariffa]|uniref:Uncharacterized protein n=2 Tax=Hibiscus sabdariffa TaxID=183260 RepID=A0ABR2C956_9ROSI